MLELVPDQCPATVTMQIGSRGHYTVERLEPPRLFYEDPWNP